jgi:cell division protein FtsI/penicillin-binding protein 2
MVTVAGQTFACNVPDETPQNYESALFYACPAPMQRLVVNWNAAALEEILTQFGFTQNPILPLNTDVPPGEPVQNVPLALIGQENLTVTPLQIALALSTLTNGGQPVRPQLVSGVQDETGTWQPYLPPMLPSLLPVVSAGTARQIRQALPVSSGIIGQDYLVLSGPEGNMNSWYLGMAPLANPRYVLVLVLEGEEDSQVAAAIGQTLLQTILAIP